MNKAKVLFKARLPHVGVLRPAHTRGHVAGTCCSDSFVGQNFVPATCCVKFSWFGFVHHERGQNDPNFQCRIVCTALGNCPHYKIVRTNKNAPLAIP